MGVHDGGAQNVPCVVEGNPDVGRDVGDIAVLEWDAVAKEIDDVSLVVGERSIFALRYVHVIQL